MGSWERETPARFLNASSLAFVCVLLGSCSLKESSTERTFPPSPIPTQPTLVALNSEDRYIETCRAKGVPIPPDWKRSSPKWESHGNLRTILLTPNGLEQTPVDETSFASVWSYAPLQEKGACIALGRNGGSFQIICQSASTGHACFWGNDPISSHTNWTPETTDIPITSLRDPVQGFPPGTVACTECHRGNNAFLYAPDDPTWATVLRPEHPRPTFSTRVEQSSAQGHLTFGSTTIIYPRFIPIGGKSMVLNNPLPTTTGCSGSCHELHIEMLKKNYTMEGYVRAPRPMGPSCAANSPPDDPAMNCYHR
ncbi:MAG TPA: hypothetical protein PKD12_12515 [Nitrospira sp.]|nr:hypothetical protein [Nitrospira sp.]